VRQVLIATYSGLAHVPKALLQKRHSNCRSISASCFLLCAVTELVRDLKLLVLAPGRRGLTGLVCSVLEFLVLTLLCLVRF